MSGRIPLPPHQIQLKVKRKKKKTLNPSRPKVSLSNNSKPDQTLAFSTATGPSTPTPTIPVHISRKLHPPDAHPIPRTILPNLYISPNLLRLDHAVFCVTLTVCIGLFQTTPFKGRVIGGGTNGEQRNSSSRQYSRTSSVASLAKLNLLRALSTSPSLADAAVV